MGLLLVVCCVFFYLCLFLFKYCRPFEVSSLKYPRTSRCTRVFPLSSYILCKEVSVASPGTYWIFLPFLPAHGKANPLEHRYRRMLHHDKAIITTDTSTAMFTVHLLPSDVLRACKTANTAFVWLVGISTLQIMPSQQETHSVWPLSLWWWQPTKWHSSPVAHFLVTDILFPWSVKRWTVRQYWVPTK